MKLYVGSLPYSVSEDDLKELFQPFGEISSIQLIVDKYSGQSKGFGFVEMENNSEADTVIKALNEKPYKGRPIKVNQAQARNERPRRSRRY